MAHYLTKEGLEKLKEELHQLKTVVRKEVIERIAAAKELGDLRENAEYAEAKDDQALIESKIAEMEQTVKDAVVIDEKQGKHSVVTIGSHVVISGESGSREYTIVGSEEADPLQNRVSHESPIGKALLGKRAGDSVVIKAPKGEYSYTIASIQ